MQHPAERHEIVLDDAGADIAAIEHRELNDASEVPQRHLGHAKLDLEANHVAWRPGKRAQAVLAGSKGGGPARKAPFPCRYDDPPF